MAANNITKTRLQASNNINNATLKFFTGKKIINIVRNFLNILSFKKNIFFYKKFGNLDLYYLQFFNKNFFYKKKYFIKESIIKFLIKDLFLKYKFKFNILVGNKNYKKLLNVFAWSSTNNNKIKKNLKIFNLLHKSSSNNKIKLKFLFEIFNFISFLPRFFLIINHLFTSDNNKYFNFIEIIAILLNKYSNIFLNYNCSSKKKPPVLLIYLNSIFNNLKGFFKKIFLKKPFKLLTYKNLFLKYENYFYFFKNSKVNFLKTNLFLVSFNNFYSNPLPTAVNIKFIFKPILCLPQLINPKNFLRNKNFNKNGILLVNAN